MNKFVSGIVMMWVSNAALAAGADKPLVVASVRPLALIVQDVCQSLCKVQALLPEGVSEHHWNMTAKDILKFEKASLGIGVGLGFDERFFKPLESRPKERLSVLLIGEDLNPRPWAKEVSKPAASKGHKGHAHHDHDHGTFDPHIWFDPIRMSKAVELITVRLATMLPKEEVQLKAQGAAVVRSLTQLDVDIKAMSLKWGAKTVVVLHDSFGYWSERYSQSTKALVHGGSGHEVSAKTFGAIANELKGKSVAGVAVERVDGTAKNLARTLSTKVVLLDVSAKSNELTYESWLRAFARDWDELMR